MSLGWTQERVLPRFMSLKTDSANVHEGPSMQHSVKHRYVRKGIPLKVTGEIDDWRLVTDWEGYEGWIHRDMLSDERFAIIKSDGSILRQKDDIRSKIIAYVQRGLMVTLIKCEGDWCAISVNDEHQGFILRDSLWGVFPQ